MRLLSKLEINGTLVKFILKIEIISAGSAWQDSASVNRTQLYLQAEQIQDVLLTHTRNIGRSYGRLIIKLS